VLIICWSTATAQDQPAPATRSTGVTITASAIGERVRFAAPSSIVQIRLEVYNSSGRKLFDNELRGGNVLDWHLRDGQAEPLPDGDYLCLITVKSLSGKLTQTIGSVTVEKGAGSLQTAASLKMTTQQAEAIGPVEENASLTVFKEDDHPVSAVIAHNGEDGQITRSRGALSFRMGDFFSAKDIEQMRLTPEGNLGIGITNPQVRLDVDGMIRASQGIVFPDGSVQFSAARRTFGAVSLGPGQFEQKSAQGQEHLSPDIGGTGTTGRIAKWQDGPNGILGDSNITETSGAIGINGTPDTRFRLDVNGSTRIRGSNPGFNLEGARPAGNIWLFQTVDDDGRFRLFSQDNVNPGVERFTIGLSTGNVGIGTPNPQSKLAVQTFTLNYGITHTDGAVTVGSFIDATGGWLGTRSNHPLHFFTNNGSQQMTINTAGKVGIGTTDPFSKLHIRSGANGLPPRLQSTGTTSFAAGWDFYHDLTGKGYVGVPDTGQGLAPGEMLLYGSVGTKTSLWAGGNRSLTIDTNSNVVIGGHATQWFEKGGLVKAMVFVNWALPDGQKIERCFNSFPTVVTTPPCGITVDHTGEGRFEVRFPFDINGRFFSLTTVNSNNTYVARITGFLGSFAVFVNTFEATNGFSRNSDFFLIVY